MARVADEIEYLKSRIKQGKIRVVARRGKVSGKEYFALEIKDMPINPDKWDTKKGVGSSNVMFLVPKDYPKYPPVGLYVNFPPKDAKVADHHKYMQGAYGAPDLRDRGYYWYCAGFSREFARDGLPIWEPHPVDFTQGDNLLKLHNLAITALNTGDSFDEV